MNFKEKLKLYNEINEEIEEIKNDLRDLTKLKKVFDAYEINEFYLKAHEPYRDYSGHVVSGKYHIVEKAPNKNLLKDIANLISKYQIETTKKLESVEKERIKLEQGGVQ